MTNQKNRHNKKDHGSANPEHHAQSGAHKWFRRPDWWVVVFTGLLVVVGAATAKLLIGQLREMQKQTTTTQNQFRLDQRPMIWLSSLKDVSPGRNIIDIEEVSVGGGKEEVAADVNITNFGKSPAEIVWDKRAIGTGSNAYDSAKIPASPHKIHLVLPSSGGEFMTVFSDAMTNEQAKAALNTNGGVVVRAEFGYRDSLGFTYESDLCLGRQSNKVWAACEPNGIKDCSVEQCDDK